MPKQVPSIIAAVSPPPAVPAHVAISATVRKCAPASLVAIAAAIAAAIAGKIVKSVTAKPTQTEERSKRARSAFGVQGHTSETPTTTTARVSAQSRAAPPYRPTVEQRPPPMAYYMAGASRLTTSSGTSTSFATHLQQPQSRRRAFTQRTAATRCRARAARGVAW